MLIDAHDVTIKQLNPLAWEIHVECPSKVKMFGRVRIPQLNEEMAYQIYKQNIKKFAIDAETISVIVEEKIEESPKEPEKVEEKPINEKTDEENKKQ